MTNTIKRQIGAFIWPIILYTIMIYYIQMVIEKKKRSSLEEIRMEANPGRLDWGLLIKSTLNTNCCEESVVTIKIITMKPNSVMVGRIFDTPTTVRVSDNCVVIDCQWSNILEDYLALDMRGTNIFTKDCTFDVSKPETKTPNGIPL